MNECPLKRDHFNRIFPFPSTFRGELLVFRGGNKTNLPPSDCRKFFIQVYLDGWFFHLLKASLRVMFPRKNWDDNGKSPSLIGETSSFMVGFPAGLYTPSDTKFGIYQKPFPPVLFVCWCLPICKFSLWEKRLSLENQKKMGKKNPGQHQSRGGGETVGVLKRNDSATDPPGNRSPCVTHGNTPRLHILFSPKNHLKKNTKCTNKIGDGLKAT